MTFRHRAAGWALLALSIALASCESIPPVSNRYRIHRDRSAETRGLFKHLPYNLASNELAARVRGISDRETVNRAFAIFDLSAYLSLLKNDGAGGVEGTQGGSALLATLDRGEVVTGESMSQLETTQGGGDLVSQEDTSDIVTAESESEIDQSKQEGRVESTEEIGKALRVQSASRFASQAAFEDYVKNWANHLRVHNAAIADIIEQDQVLRMIFQVSKERFTKLIQESTISRGDLLRFEKSISVEEIVPGETFEYTLEAHNTALATIKNITLYDEFPVFLHFERNFRATITRADGNNESFDETSHPSFFQSAVTDDEWERGKICWIVASDFRHGDTLKLSFDATWYRSRGEPSTDGVPLYAGLTASDDEVVTRLEARDRVFLIEPSEENTDFLRVFVRRPVETDVEKGNKVTKLEKLDGFLLAEHFRQEVEEDATDLERRMQVGGTSSDEE